MGFGMEGLPTYSLEMAKLDSDSEWCEEVEESKPESEQSDDSYSVIDSKAETQWCLNA